MTKFDTAFCDPRSFVKFEFTTAQELQCCDIYKVNWINKEDHSFNVPEKYADLTDDTTFKSHFGMENCLIHAKEVTEFVYHTKKESAQEPSTIMEVGDISLGYQGNDGSTDSWCFVDRYLPMSSFSPAESQVNELPTCNYTATATMSSTKRAKPCLEDIPLIGFQQNEITENKLFGPKNNLYAKQTRDELIEAIEWLDDSGAEESELGKEFESNITRLLEFEDYKEEMINNGKRTNAKPVSYELSFGCMHLRCCRAYQYGDNTEDEILQFKIEFFLDLITESDEVIGEKGLDLNEDQIEFIYEKSTNLNDEMRIELTDRMVEFLEDQRIYQNHRIAILVDSQERRYLKNFYNMMAPMKDYTEIEKVHYERLGNLILIHINIAPGANQQYQVEWINGTSLAITEAFNFVQPSCPNMNSGEPFADFQCFDYKKDTIRTITSTTEPPTTTAVTVRVPIQHIAIISGLGGATTIVLLGIIVYKIITS